MYNSHISNRKTTHFPVNLGYGNISSFFYFSRSIFLCDFLSRFCDFPSQFRRIEYLDAPGFAEHPAENFVLEGRFQRDDQGIVRLAFDLEFFHLLVFIKIEGDGGVTAELNTVNSRIFEKPGYAWFLPTASYPSRKPLRRMTLHRFFELRKF